jgi:hypothetical protein
MAVDLQQMSGMPRAAMAAVVLARMRSVRWARVDCAWRDAQMSMFAHNNIQVTRGWLNWDVRPSRTAVCHGTYCSFFPFCSACFVCQTR